MSIFNLGASILFLFLTFFKFIFSTLWRPFARFIWNFNSKKRGSRPRILILKEAGLSEAVNILPAVHLIKKQFKEGHLTLLARPSEGSLLAKTKLFDRVETFSMRTVWELMSANFMLVIDFEKCSWLTAFSSCFINAPASIGFETKQGVRDMSQEESVKFNEEKAIAENYWSLAKLACEICGRTPNEDFNKTKEELREILKDELLKGSLQGATLVLPQILYVFHMGCGEKGWPRQWPRENWLELARYLKGRSPDCKIWLTGRGEDEESLANQFMTDCGEWCVSKVNRLSFDELFQVLTQAKMIYSVDSGMAHLASLLSDHTVTLMGPRDSQVRAPLWGGAIVKSTIECSPCLTWGHDYGCSDPVCMKTIEWKRVVR